MNAALATSRRVTERSVPATVNLPSAKPISASDVSSICAAIRLPLAAILSAASTMAEPPIEVERDPKVPMPKVTRSVSPSTTRMSSISMPRCSLRICL